MINYVNTHFDSFEKSAEEKVKNEFNVKRLRNLKRIIAKDKVTLDESVKSMKDALLIGGNLYNSFLSLKKFIVDIEKKSKAHEDEMEHISQIVDPMSVSFSSHEI